MNITSKARKALAVARARHSHRRHHPRACTYAATAADIVVGQVAPLSGVLASTGRDMVAGARIYFERINANGGIRSNRINHVVLDDGYKVDETVRLTRAA
ncbi:MAG: ABC transporter substrate-binding protein [Rhodocyclaceae bacterium]